MPSGNGTSALDPASDVRDVRRQLAAAKGVDKVDLLLSAPDPLALVHAIPSQELFQAILEVGLDDAAEVVALASPGQFAHFLDRTVWPRASEPPQTREVLRWLTLARGGASRSDQALSRYRQKLAGLDAELLELVLFEQLKVHDIEEGVDLPIEDFSRTWRTPDGKYVIEFAVEGTDYATLKQLLEDLFAQGPFEAMRLMEAVRWELPSELTETARRWRDGRLRDLGYPQIDEALSFFARPARRTGQATPDAQAGTALTANEGPLLERALPLVPEEALPFVEEGLVYAANAALVVANLEPNDLHGARAVLQDARATVSLGLEVLAGGDASRAAQLLSERPVRELFQAGMGERYALQSRARRIAQASRLPSAKSATLLESPHADLLETLQRKQPLLFDPKAPRLSRAPGSRADVARAEAQLDEAEAILAILGELGLSPAALEPLAAAAGLGPSAVRASDALRARARAAVLGREGVLFPDSDSGPQSESGTGPSAEAVAAKLAELVREAAARIGTPAALRAAELLSSSRR